ncbi:hypothetical protein ACJX0J_004751 (mitochondrion) [Zea mays]
MVLLFYVLVYGSVGTVLEVYSSLLDKYWELVQVQLPSFTVAVNVLTRAVNITKDEVSWNLSSVMQSGQINENRDDYGHMEFGTGSPFLGKKNEPIVVLTTWLDAVLDRGVPFFTTPNLKHLFPYNHRRCHKQPFQIPKMKAQQLPTFLRTSV